MRALRLMILVLTVGCRYGDPDPIDSSAASNLALEQADDASAPSDAGSSGADNNVVDSLQELDRFQYLVGPTADTIALVRFSNKQSRFSGGTEPENLVSDYAVSVSEIMRGRSVVNITVTGGRIGDVAYTNYGVPKIVEGQSYLAFMRSDADVTRLIEAAFVRDGQVALIGGEWIPLQRFRAEMAGH